MATKKYLDEDGLVQYTGKVKKAINDASYTHGVTDIDGTTVAPSVDTTVNATANQRSAAFTKDGGSDSFPYYDTTYGNAVAGSKDGLMSRSDKTKLDGIATGAEVNVQSDWNQTTTTADDYIKNKPTFKTINNVAITGSGNIAVQTPLTFDNAPTENSQKLVRSGGIRAAIDAVTTDLDTVEEGKGSDMVAYSSNDSVKDALDDIYSQIGPGGGESSLSSRVEALEDGGNLVEGTNVTLTKDTTNHTVTIAAADPTVTQTEDTTSATAIPLLLASGGTPTSPAGAKFNPKLSFKPSTNELKLGSSAIGIEMSFKDGGITFSSGLNSATINATNYSGTAAQATADGSGNNIVNTYATKAALDALSDKWTGQFMVIKNSGDTQAMYAAMTRIIAAIKEGVNPAAADMALFELGYIYLYPNTVVAEDNVFDEYIKVLELNGSDYTMEKIGTTDAGVDVVSLTPAEINTIWSTTAAAS